MILLHRSDIQTIGMVHDFLEVLGCKNIGVGGCTVCVKEPDVTPVRICDSERVTLSDVTVFPGHSAYDIAIINSKDVVLGGVTAGFDRTVRVVYARCKPPIILGGKVKVVWWRSRLLWLQLLGQDILKLVYKVFN